MNTDNSRSQSKTELEHHVRRRARLKKRVNFCKRWVTHDHENVHHPVVACRSSEPPRTLGDAKAMIDSALATTSHDLRTNVSQVTGYSPGVLAFNRHVILDKYTIDY